MKIRIGSFNMRNLRLSSNRDLDRIANIIKDNQLDIVAMQEVLSEGKRLSGVSLKKEVKNMSKFSLLSRLGSNWAFHWEDPYTDSRFYPYLGEDQRGEGYAFLWNTQKVDLLLGKDPQIFREYKSTYDGSPALRLIRDPLYARFLVKITERVKTKIELRLITTHIIYGKPDAMNTKVSIDGGTAKLRQHEFNLLAGSIYSKISDHRKDVESTASYTLILGDYNLNLRSSGIGVPVVDDIAFFDSSGRRLYSPTESCRIIHTCQSAPTTLGGKSYDDTYGYANNYDHCSFDENTRMALHPICTYIDAVHQHVHPEDQTEEEKFSRYKKDVSDHVPIVVEISF